MSPYEVTSVVVDLMLLAWVFSLSGKVDESIRAALPTEDTDA